MNAKPNSGITTVVMIIAASLVGLITGYTIPLISIDLTQQHVDTIYIGLLAATPAVGMILSSLFTPFLCRRVEIPKLVAMSLMLLVASTFFSCLNLTFTWLFLPRLLNGVASGILIVLGESWVTGHSSRKYRATITGIYTSVFTGFQLAGPLIITAGPDYHNGIMLFICLTVGVCLLLLTKVSIGSELFHSNKTSWRSLVVFLPIFTSGVFCFAFFDASILALFPLYGMDMGLDKNTAILLVSVILVGDALLQVPIGWLADKAGLRRVHIVCGVLFSLCIVLVHFTIQNTALLITSCVILGATGGGMYTLSLVRAGKVLAGQKLIMMNAIIGIVWSIGSISGPVFNGITIDVVGYDGMIWLLFLVGVLFVLIQLISKDRKEI